MKRTLLRVLLVVVLLVIGLIIIGECSSPSTPGEPTSIPKVEETPKIEETLTVSEQNYFTGLTKNSNTVSEALTEFGNLTQNPQIGNDDWTVKVAIQLVTIQTAYEEVIKMNPPNSLREIHNEYVQAISCYNDMTYLFAQGIDNNDPELIGKATQKIEEGTELINEVTAAVNKFKIAHGW